MSTDKQFSDWIRDELEDLRRIRDELKLKAHLAKAELRDTWEQIEEGFEELELHGKRVARAAEEPLRDIQRDARKLAGDLRNGFRRIRDSI